MADSVIAVNQTISQWVSTRLTADTVVLDYSVNPSISQWVSSGLMADTVILDYCGKCTQPYFNESTRLMANTLILDYCSEPIYISMRLH